MIEHDGLALSWLGYATIRIAAADADSVVYLDPGRYGVLEDYDGGDADVVCVTHDHHYDTDTVRTVADEDATLVLFEGINTHRIDRDVERPADLPFEIRSVDAESDLAVGDAIVRTTAAYNRPAGPHVRPSGEPYHPEGLGCGFHVTLAGTAVYWPGDTDVLDGHERLDVDVFCPPIGGTYTMDRHEAADLAVAMQPDLVVPVHYGTFEAIEADAEALAADLESRGVRVALDE
jgi:L-ascorbate metabolism protein UlaG (beta-lactamase superfamily)